MSKLRWRMRSLCTQRHSGGTSSFGMERDLRGHPALVTLRPVEKSRLPPAVTCPVRAKREALVTPAPHQGPPCDPVGEHLDQSGWSSEFMSRCDRSLVLKARFAYGRRSRGPIEAAAREERPGSRRRSRASSGGAGGRQTSERGVQA